MIASTSHLEALARAMQALRPELEHIEHLGAHAAEMLSGGGRLLAVGNGGSAAQAQHLTAELVGRFRDERQPLSAIALHADTSSLTAIGNDYGPEQMYARQVMAHGRRGDVLVALSTSGRSPNVVAAADVARTIGVRVWGLTGPRPNPLADRCDHIVAVPAASTATVQEVHLVVIHLLCAAIDAAITTPHRRARASDNEPVGGDTRARASDSEPVGA
jgi:D-sedoheptulose 7-phosphate isomerase